MTLSRRDLLKMGVLAGASVALPLERGASADSTGPNRLAASLLPRPFTVPFGVPELLVPFRADATTDYYRVIMQPFPAQVLPGFTTPLWGYNAQVPGPTVRITRGRRAVIRQVNALPAQHPVLGYTPWTSVHLHGSPSAPQYDGYASDITNPGQYKDYRYDNLQPARTLWYHDHGVHHTAENVLMGLAAQYHLIDPADQVLHLPTGPYDMALTVADAMFTADGGLLFDDHDETGMFGDVILVNGRPWPVLQVARRKYRFRILNASVTRSYAWSLDSGEPMTIIATDAGLMPFPQQVLSFRHAPAERYEVVIDFSAYPVGRRVVLGNTSPKNNIEYDNTDKVMAFDVVGHDFDPADNSVPEALNPDGGVMALTEQQAVNTVQLNLVRQHGRWTINGHTWDDVVASGFRLVEATATRGDVVIFELRNDSGGWHHPVHLHAIDFKILDRNAAPPMAHELGPKDVVYLGENETVRVITRFDVTGTYMMHCHNLVHEDHDMMSQLRVLNVDGSSGTDPLSEPALTLPETGAL